MKFITLNGVTRTEGQSWGMCLRVAVRVTAMSPLCFPLHAGTDLPVCASCGQGIYDGQYLQALNADWHADCFR